MKGYLHYSYIFHYNIINLLFFFFFLKKLHITFFHSLILIISCTLLSPSPYRHEALTSALSEKDAHLALLEVGGVRCSRTAQEIDSLKKERGKLLEAIKHQVSNEF